LGRGKTCPPEVGIHTAAPIGGCVPPERGVQKGNPHRGNNTTGGEHQKETGKNTGGTPLLEKLALQKKGGEPITLERGTTGA